MYARHILLTGAGFSHNFGVPLARGMWNLILGSAELRSAPRVRELLNRSDDFDFERIYNDVMSGDGYSEVDRRALGQAVEGAYEHVFLSSGTITTARRSFGAFSAGLNSRQVGPTLSGRPTTAPCRRSRLI